MGFNIELEIKETPLSITGNIELYGKFDIIPPGINKALNAFGFNLSIGVKVALSAEVNYHECKPSSLKFCGNVSVFADAQFKSSFAAQVSLEGGGKICYDLCSGNVTVNGFYSVEVYFKKFLFLRVKKTEKFGEFTVMELPSVNCPRGNNE